MSAKDHVENESTAPEAPEADDPGATGTTTQTWDEDRARAKISKANAEAQSLRKRVKELEPLAQKLKELEEQDKSEQQKLTDRATAAEQRAQEAELRALRIEVAVDKGLTSAQARRLVGTTREELEADADELLDAFGGKSEQDKPPESPDAKPGVTRKPSERLRGGSDPDEPPEETDYRKLAALVPRR